MAAEPRKSIAVAITGASGAIYATRTLAALLANGVQVEAVISDYGRRLLRDELGEEAAVERLTGYLVSKYGDDVRRGGLTLHSNRDLGAPIDSRFPTDGQYETYHAVPAIGYELTRNIQLLAEVGVGLDGDSDDYASAGMSWYFR